MTSVSWRQACSLISTARQPWPPPPCEPRPSEPGESYVRRLDEATGQFCHSWEDCRARVKPERGPCHLTKGYSNWIHSSQKFTRWGLHLQLSMQPPHWIQMLCDLEKREETKTYIVLSLWMLEEHDWLNSIELLPNVEASGTHKMCCKSRLPPGFKGLV